MSVKGLTALTLADWGKRVDPNGKVDKIIELLGQTNPILQDMPFVEGNLPTGHRTTIRSGLPSATWRLLNYGVQPSKSTTVQVTDSVGMLETYAEVDKSLADLNGNTAEFRLSEDRAFIEAMNQQMAQTLFYGDSSVNPQQFMGLSSRYSSLSAGNAQNIIDAGGTGTDNTSIWLVVWGKNTVHGIFPKGQKAGIQMEDKGQVTLGKMLMAASTKATVPITNGTTDLLCVTGVMLFALQTSMSAIFQNLPLPQILRS